jgi:cytochrome c
MASWGHLQPLSAEFYTLLRYGLFLVLFIHLPYIGVLIGGSAVSLLLTVLGTEKREPDYLRFSRELMDTVWTGRMAMFMFGIVPPLMVWAVYARILFSASPLPWPFWVSVLVLLVLGFALLQWYRSAGDGSSGLHGPRVGAGASGLLALLFAFFLFSTGYGILFDPGKLVLLQKQLRFILSWNAVVKFLLFLTLFFGMTGGLILLLGGRSPGGKEGPDAGYRAFVRDVGATLAFSAALVLPVFLLLDLITLPWIALSAREFATVATVLVLAFAVCLVLSLARGKGDGGTGRPVAVLYVLIFLGVLAHDHAAVGNVYRDRIAFLDMQAVAAEAAHAQEAHKTEPAAAAPSALEEGKHVFETICSACHRFDIRVVGPPLNERVPKYHGDVEKLKGFIRNPVKLTPGYPSMPKLGLPEKEIDAVSRYLIEHVKEEPSK